MEKEQIDEILNKMFEIKEENGEKIIKFIPSKKTNVKSDRKRKAKSNSSNTNGKI
jgi:hypothetical protein